MLIMSCILLEGLDHATVDTAHQPDLDLHAQIHTVDPCLSEALRTDPCSDK